MGQTPIYQLPWPEESDPPDGPVQIRALALATEAAINPVDTRLPGLPSFRAPILGGAVTAAGTNRLGMNAAGLVVVGGAAHLVGTDSIIIDAAGTYLGFLSLNTTNTGTIASGAYLTLQFRSPFASPLNSVNIPMFGSGPLTAQMVFPMGPLPVGREVAVSATNNSTQTQNVVSGLLTLVRVSA